ncbi:MAG: RDD family protein [Bacilli bacterium]|nr:RDD family protein [Bacilli bacterium]
MVEQLLISAKPSKRIGALILDLLINAAVSAILLIPGIIALANVFVDVNHGRAITDTANIIALFIAALGCGALIVSFAIFYFVCLPSIWEGQTIGKRVTKIRVVDITTNEGPNAKTMFLRESSRILIFILSFGLSAIASLLTLCLSETHTTFHEQISSTRVVNVNIYNENSGNPNPSSIDQEQL